MHNKFSTALFIFLIGGSLKLFSQGNTVSPYGVIGIGELEDEAVAAQDMMGGTGASFSNSFYVNQINPALLVKNRTIGLNKYVSFNVGTKGAYTFYDQGNISQRNFNMGLTNFTFVFPIGNHYAASLSLRPVSSANFKSFTTREFTNTGVITNYQFTSDGGISRVASAHSFKITKNLYLGLEGQYNFGTINRDTLTNILGETSYFGSSGRLDFHGISYKAGIAYSQKLSSKWNLNLGLAYQSNSNLKGHNVHSFANYSDLGNGLQPIANPDTLSVTSIRQGLPESYKVGISFESPYHFVFAIDYGKGLWSRARQFDKHLTTLIRDSQQFRFGFEWLPKYNSNRYFNQVFYRIGFKHEESPYKIFGHAIKDQSISLGFSLPLGYRAASYVDLAVAFGKKGVNQDQLIQERYTQISLNFSLLGLWFHKPKLD